MTRLGVVAVAIVVGLSIPSDGGSVRQPSNPCAFIAAPEVAVVVGGPVGDGLLTTMARSRGCVFMPRANFAMPGTNAGFEYARVLFLDAPAYDEATAPQGPYLQPRPVAGLGDAAVEIGRPHYEGLFVRKGDYRVEFDVAVGWTSLFAPELGIARIVVPRLPA